MARCSYLQLRRNEFFGVLGGAAVVCPLTADAQQGEMSVIGFINSA